MSLTMTADMAILEFIFHELDFGEDTGEHREGEDRDRDAEEEQEGGLVHVLGHLVPEDEGGGSADAEGQCHAGHRNDHRLLP